MPRNFREIAPVHPIVTICMRLTIQALIEERQSEGGLGEEDTGFGIGDIYYDDFYPEDYRQHGDGSGW